MTDFILLMHVDTTSTPASEAWDAYFSRLASLGVFDGGSAIGKGAVYRKAGPAGPSSGHIDGYIRVRAASLAAARALLEGNPVYECGGSVEIRELPRDD